MLFCVVCLLLLTGCWNQTSNNDYESDSYSEQTQDSKNCPEPENPYSAWWHYEWWKRWEEWNSCDWNSDSFIEWCDEYTQAESDYNKCLSR